MNIKDIEFIFPWTTVDFIFMCKDCDTQSVILLNINWKEFNK